MPLAHDNDRGTGVCAQVDGVMLRTLHPQHEVVSRDTCVRSRFTIGHEHKAHVPN